MQGVGFRYRVMQIAARFDVAGSVRNLRSGAVEVDAEGDDPEVVSFIDAVLQNPPAGARVDSVTQRDATPRGARGFGVGRD